jgi:hypothetical protein
VGAKKSISLVPKLLLPESSESLFRMHATRRLFIYLLDNFPSFDIVVIHKQIMDDYRQFVSSFIHIKDDRSGYPRSKATCRKRKLKSSSAKKP